MRHFQEKITQKFILAMPEGRKMFLSFSFLVEEHVGSHSDECGGLTWWNYKFYNFNAIFSKIKFCLIIYAKRYQ